ncbi:hypothetical protein BH11ACT4_BH11ACT4_11320 [soil metagenome]
MTHQAAPLLMPTLSAGKHRGPRQGACFMEFASYLAGERWSDHPSCTHFLLAALARDVNDLTSDAARGELMPLVTRVIGLTGDDPRLVESIAVRAASAALPVASMDRQHALAVGLLGILRSTTSTELIGIAEHALALAPEADRWARAYLATTPTRGFGRQSALAIVHTSAVGIALACVADPDARLAALLRDAIAASEQLLGRAPAIAPAADTLQLA